MNVHDSERMAGLLEQAGYELTVEPRDADVVVINTCSVREGAEHKLYTRLGEVRQASRETGRTPVVAAPAVSRAGAGAMLRRSNLIDVIIGTRAEKAACAGGAGARRLRGGRSAHRRQKLRGVSFPLGVARSHDRSRRSHHHRGCNEFCSFCVVPYTRGASA